MSNVQVSHRRPLRADLDVARQVIEIENVRCLPHRKKTSWFHGFNLYGFVLLRCRSIEGGRANLCRLKGYFEHGAPHPRADEDEIRGDQYRDRNAGFYRFHKFRVFVAYMMARIRTIQKLYHFNVLSRRLSGGDSILGSARAVFANSWRGTIPMTCRRFAVRHALFIERNAQ
ncbi:MAG: hypothetical protein V6Z86_03290 [Hyphomicrobiales bacterium]